MATQAKGNWQAAGTRLVAAKGTNDLFDIKDISDVFKNAAINTISTNTTVELKQPLSINTVSRDGDALDPQDFTAGQCKITKISKDFGTLQDCSIDKTGSVVYTFLVKAPKLTDKNACYGVQISATKGTGEMMPGSGMGQNTFLFQIK
ncbi:hypothetical protein N0V91_008465 [Didymella pomorum]|jgi:hypothetical protein|uniref:Uncharacterized protein n=1 Tax=Didymella pomorum TaxID=749634 RepID=A0A9W9D4D2_9PLEO|nr:hypothetical protein N0V91_008465 [Didymella pomorum]